MRKVLVLAGLLGLGACASASAPPEQWRHVQDGRGNWHTLFKAGDQLVEVAPGQWTIWYAGNPRPYVAEILPSGRALIASPHRLGGLPGVLATITTGSNVLGGGRSDGRSNAGFWAGHGMAAPSWGLR
jgi:hypothetical protein